MIYDDVMKTIRDSECDDWLFDDEKGIFTLRDDLDVRIERRDPDDLLASYTEPWANNHSDLNATRVFFDIYYRSSFVETFMLVYVDGARACLPYPDAGTTIIPFARYRLARAVDHQDKLDEYIQRSSLTVAKP